MTKLSTWLEDKEYGDSFAIQTIFSFIQAIDEQINELDFSAYSVVEKDSSSKLIMEIPWCLPQLLQLLSKGVVDMITLRELPIPLLAFRTLPTNEIESVSEYYSGKEYSHYSFHLLRPPLGRNLNKFVEENYFQCDGHQINDLKVDDTIICPRELLRINGDRYEKGACNGCNDFLAYIVLGCESDNTLHHKLFWSLRSAAISSLSEVHGISTRLFDNESYYLVQALMVVVARVIWRRSGTESGIWSQSAAHSDRNLECSTTSNRAHDADFDKSAYQEGNRQQSMGGQNWPLENGKGIGAGERGFHRREDEIEKSLSVIFSPFSATISAHDDLSSLWTILLKGSSQSTFPCFHVREGERGRDGRREGEDGEEKENEMVRTVKNSSTVGNSSSGLPLSSHSTEHCDQKANEKNKVLGISQGNSSDDAFYLTTDDTLLTCNHQIDVSYSGGSEGEGKGDDASAASNGDDSSSSGFDFSPDDGTWRDVVPSCSLLSASTLFLFCGGLSACDPKYLNHHSSLETEMVETSRKGRSGEEEEEEEEADSDVSFLSRISYARKYLKVEENVALDELLRFHASSSSKDIDTAEGAQGRRESKLKVSHHIHANYRVAVWDVDAGCHSDSDSDNNSNINSNSNSDNIDSNSVCGAEIEGASESESGGTIGLESLTKQSLLLNAIRKAVQAGLRYVCIAEPHERRNERMRNSLRDSLGESKVAEDYGGRGAMGCHNIRSPQKTVYNCGVGSTRSRRHSGQDEKESEDARSRMANSLPFGLQSVTTTSSAPVVKTTSRDCRAIICSTNTPFTHVPLHKKKECGRSDFNKKNTNSAMVLGNAAEKRRGVSVGIKALLGEESCRRSVSEEILQEMKTRASEEIKDAVRVRSQSNSSIDAAVDPGLSMSSAATSVASVDRPRPPPPSVSLSLHADPIIWPAPCPLHPNEVVLIGLDSAKCRILRSSKYPALLVFHAYTRGHRGCDSGKGGGGRDGRNQPSFTQSSNSSKFPAHSRASHFPTCPISHLKSDPVPNSVSDLKSRGQLSSYMILYKQADDIRQDELATQLIRFMNFALKAQCLDLRLLTYEVLSLGPREGLIQWIDGAEPLSSIIDRSIPTAANDCNRSAPSCAHTQSESLRANPIHTFLRNHNHSDTDEFGVDEDVIETFIRSCAGYSVITYILGVGDRHLDNLMLMPTGHFFHVDYGFLFGRDPKPFRPLVRFTAEMLAAMGGQDHPVYHRFITFCCSAYNILRATSGGLISFLYLAATSGLRDLSDKQTPDEALSGVLERLHLDLSDTAAEDLLKGLILESAAAIMPRVLEQMHRIASTFR